MAKSISFFDVQRVKRRAKQLHASSQNIPLGKCQDEAARELFAARNFHELNQWRNRTITELSSPRHEPRPVSHNDTAVVTCAFCGTIYYPGAKEDLAEHRKKHDRFEEATSALRYIPELHAAREARKNIGHEQMRNSDPDIRLSGAIEILRGWFDRSLDSAIDGNYWKKHPDFERYISCLTGDLSEFPPEIVLALINKYGRQDEVIKKGNRYWYPPR